MVVYSVMLFVNMCITWLLCLQLYCYVCVCVCAQVHACSHVPVHVYVHVYNMRMIVLILQASQVLTNYVYRQDRLTYVKYVMYHKYVVCQTGVLRPREIYDTVLQIVKMCSLVGRNQYFGGNLSLHLRISHCRTLIIFTAMRHMT